MTNLYEDGCWTVTNSGDSCIFISPCPKSLKDRYSISGSNEGPKGCRAKCDECTLCGCEVDELTNEEQHVCENSTVDCFEKFRMTAVDGCWTKIFKKCSYVLPCPEPYESKKSCRQDKRNKGKQGNKGGKDKRSAESDESSSESDEKEEKDDDPCQCGCKRDGMRSCQRCQSCECLGRAKFCKGSSSECPDPTVGGCFVNTSDDGCEYRHPCPVEQSECEPSESVNLLTDFCYRYSEALGRCEFISPCPGSCCERDQTVECRLVITVAIIIA